MPDQRGDTPRPSGASGKRGREEEEEEVGKEAKEEGRGGGGAELHLGSWLQAEVQMLPISPCSSGCRVVFGK